VPCAATGDVPYCYKKCTKYVTQKAYYHLNISKRHEFSDLNLSVLCSDWKEQHQAYSLTQKCANMCAQVVKKAV
jgi:hypothetical protein